MKLLYVLENYLPHVGGAEIVFQNLCEGLAKKGHDVTIVTRRLPGTKQKEVLNGVRVIRVKTGSRYGFTFRSFPEVYRQAKHAEVIHANTPNGGPPAWLAAKLLGKPVVLHVHEVWLGRWRKISDFPAWKSAIHNFLEWCTLLPSYDRYVCVSQNTAKELARVRPGRKGRIRAILNGFDPALWKEKHDTAPLREKLGLNGAFVVLATGRPGTSKGFKDLIMSWRHVRKQVPTARLVLMLSKDAQYAHRIAEYKRVADPDVLFVDPVPYAELPVWRQMADCIVVPSTSEGFGYVVLESVASGTPVVATKAGSIPEVISGKHVLVRPRVPESIAEGITRVFRKQLTVTKEKHFPWSRTIEEHERMYAGLTK